MADKGPFSGTLFDYEKEKELLEQRKKLQLDTQQKIQRTNAIGEALRLISEGIGGSMGATITPRPVNPGILRASERFNTLGQDYENKLDRLRLEDLALKQEDLKYGLGLEATKQQRVWEGQKMGEQQAFTATQNKEERASREKIASENARNDLERQKLINQGDVNEIARRYQGEIEKMQTKEKLTGVLAQKGLFQVARYDDPSTDVIVSRNQVISLVPALKQWLLSQGINPYQMTGVLKPDVAPTKIPDDQLKMLIGQYHEFFKTRLPELSGGESALPQQQPMGNSALFPGGWQQQPTYQQGQGPLRSYGGPAMPVNPVVYPIVQADKSGNYDLSIYYK